MQLRLQIDACAEPSGRSRWQDWWRAPRQPGISPAGTARRRIRRHATGGNSLANIDQSPAVAGRRVCRKSAQDTGTPGRRSSPGPCVRRDPPEEPPSEERYGAEGRSPGLRVIAVVPAFPGLVQKPSDAKWNRHSPLTVAGAAPDSAPKGATGFPS